MSLSPGTRLGPYEIVGVIGAGGMGEVYRARDTKLDRSVAIKVLPDAFAGDSERLVRFEREAKLLASLNHPNIAQIYGLEGQVRADGHEGRALVMELVDGETLRGPMALDEALPVARQIGDALEAAHERGIVHRDLKPSNIRLRPDGTVKVLDFGLSKAFDQASGSGFQAATELTVSPTVTSPGMRTGAGVILGTAAYMAPEQARGRSVDKRADIWAFGVVLYELLTGERLFKGDDLAETLASVVKDEPDLSKAPWQVRRLLKKCLEKDPRKRLRDIGDAWELLDSDAPQRGEARRLTLPLAMGAALLLAVLAAIGWLRPQRGPARGLASDLTLDIAQRSAAAVTAVGTFTATPEISPDGSSVLYRSRSPRIVLRRLNSEQLVSLHGTEGAINAHFWSTDSKSMFFTDRKALIRLRVPDGPAQTLASISAPVHGITERGDGTVLFAELTESTLASSSIHVIRPGAARKPITVTGLKDGDYRLPEFLPGGNDFLFMFRPAESSGVEVYLATLGEGTVAEPSLLMRNDTAARYTPAGGGHLLFVRNDNLYAQRLNRTARRLEGEPELIQQNVASAPAWGVAHFSVSRSGVVAWRPGRAALSQVTVFNRQGQAIGTSGQSDVVRSLALSPDETRMLVNARWLLEAGQPGRFDLGGTMGRLWSPDGSRFLTAQQSGVFEHSIGGSQARLVAARSGVRRLEDVSPDGKLVLYTRGPLVDTVFSLRLDGGAQEPAAVIQTSAAVMNPRFSPDGRWVVYVELSQGQTGIFVQPFPGTGLRRQIARGGNYPVWRKDGKEIVYLDQDRIWSVGVDQTGGELRVSPPEPLFPVRSPVGSVVDLNFLAVSRDGSRFFFPQAVEQPDSDVIHVRLGGVK